MAVLDIVRMVAFIVATVFSVIVLALSAHVTSLTEQADIPFYLTFAAMGIATALLTIFTLPVFLIIDNVRRGAVTSMIISEIVVLSILWILWLSTAGLAANAFEIFCTFSTSSGCQEIQAVEAFSFLTWLGLMAYAFVLLTFTFIAAGRGHSSVWTSSVKDTNFFAPSVQQQQQPMATGGMIPQMQMPTGGQYPPIQPQPMFVPAPYQGVPIGSQAYAPPSPAPVTQSPYAGQV
jgi:hypothetical protein